MIDYSYVDLVDTFYVVKSKTGYQEFIKDIGSLTLLDVDKIIIHPWRGGFPVIAQVKDEEERTRIINFIDPLKFKGSIDLKEI